MDIRAIQSNLSQHFLVKVKAGLGVVMTIHHCHIAGAVVAQWGQKTVLNGASTVQGAPTCTVSTSTISTKVWIL